MIQQRVALVAGGTTGIGLEICKALLAQGVSVAAASRRASDDAYKSEVEKEIPEALILSVDVGSPESIASCLAQIESTLGPVDILVNSAGVSVYQLVSEHTEEDWLNVIDTNLSGSFRTIRAVLPGMKERGWGRIVNIASTAAHTAMPDCAAYCASKSGLLGLTRAVSLEGAPHGVSCISVSPTWVETSMLHRDAQIEADSRGIDKAVVVEEYRKGNPQNRLVQPQEVGALVAFLCSEAAPAITMEDIQMNAGTHW